MKHVAIKQHIAHFAVSTLVFVVCACLDASVLNRLLLFVLVSAAYAYSKYNSNIHNNDGDKP